METTRPDNGRMETDGKTSSANRKRHTTRQREGHDNMRRNRGYALTCADSNGDRWTVGSFETRNDAREWARNTYTDLGDETVAHPRPVAPGEMFDVSPTQRELAKIARNTREQYPHAETADNVPFAGTGPVPVFPRDFHPNQYNGYASPAPDLCTFPEEDTTT